MNDSLSIETRMINGDILAIVLDGSLNTTTSVQFNQAIQNHLDQGRTKIIIDCRRVESISSIGLGSLVALQARLRKKGGEVKLAGLYGTAADVIKLVRLDKLLGIYEDTEFARESFYPSTTGTDQSSNSSPHFDEPKSERASQPRAIAGPTVDAD